jgi:hypothetical protein
MCKFEITDTFGGEANYCWVRRGTTRATTREGVAKAIKQAAGWGCRVYAHDYGSVIEVRPAANSGILQVAFAYFD